MDAWSGGRRETSFTTGPRGWGGHLPDGGFALVDLAPAGEPRLTVKGSDRRHPLTPRSVASLGQRLGTVHDGVVAVAGGEPRERGIGTAGRRDGRRHEAGPDRDHQAEQQPRSRPCPPSWPSVSLRRAAAGWQPPRQPGASTKTRLQEHAPRAAPRAISFRGVRLMVRKGPVGVCSPGIKDGISLGYAGMVIGLLVRSRDLPDPDGACMNLAGGSCWTTTALGVLPATDGPCCLPPTAQ